MTGTGTSAPERACLAEGLRELRSRTGLSMAQLGRKTTYSKSSWERYLNGKALPPRGAVQELCAVAGEPSVRYLALWELADCAWSGRGTAVPRIAEPRPPEPFSLPQPPRSAQPPGRTRRTRRGVAVVGTVLLCLMAMTAAAVPWPHPSAVATAGNAAVRCHDSGCDGRDPEGMLCGVSVGSAGTLRARTGAYLEIRYSADCGAAWARVWKTATGDRASVSAPGGAARTAEVADGYDAAGYVYTPMVAVTRGHRVHACFVAASGGAPECVDGVA